MGELIDKINAKYEPIEPIMATNKALEIADKMAPFLQPAPSDDEGLIRAAMEFTMQLDPRQLRALNSLLMLSYDPIVPEQQQYMLRKVYESYLKLKRHHKSDIIMDSFIQSLSWRKFVMAGQVQGNVMKTGQM